LNAAKPQKEILAALQTSLPAALPAYLKEQRWFGGKARVVRSAIPVDAVPFPLPSKEAVIVLIEVSYEESANEIYALPLMRTGETQTGEQEPGMLTILENCGNAFRLRNALADGEFLSALFEAVQKNLVFPGVEGQIRASSTPALGMLDVSPQAVRNPKPIKGEQSNSSIAYGDRAILKVFRRIEPGVNPDLEVGLFLTEKAHFSHTPPVAGFLEYEGKRSSMTLGTLQGFVVNQGDAWRYTAGELSKFYEQCKRSSEAQALTALGGYFDNVRLLGRRTAELHRALASDSSTPEFAPEPYTEAFQSELEQDRREATTRVFSLLRQQMTTVPPEYRTAAQELASREGDVLERFRTMLERPVRGMRTRIHGDYHLGQVLYTGSDFVIIDFEGEPARPIAERRIKRSPLQDVAGMLRSFQYAAFAPLLAAVGDTAQVFRNDAEHAQWARIWEGLATESFLGAYFETSGDASYIPPTVQEREVVLRLQLLEKAVYELGYELDNRPSWVGIPLEGIRSLLFAGG
jgi:trehalose synthase-fused probable maltokinase